MAQRRLELDPNRPLRAVGYTRVSTQKQVDSGLSLQHQEKQLNDETAKRNWELIAIFTDAGKSAKSMSRDGIAKALELLKKGKADVLVVPKQDRATRSIKDFAQLLELCNKQGWRLVDLDFDVDTTTAMGEAMAYQKAIFAQLERRLISERTKSAMAELKAQGVQLGKPSPLPQTTVDRVLELQGQGLSVRKIAAQLQAEAIPTATGAAWHPTTVQRIIDRARATRGGGQSRPRAIGVDG